MDNFHLLVMPDSKAGDLPPKGYLQWHDWAEVQYKAGIKQTQCPTCGLWCTPQELSSHKINWTLENNKRETKHFSGFECSSCFSKREAIKHKDKP